MKPLKILLVTAVMIILWAGQAMGETIYLDMPESDYTIGELERPIAVENSDWTKANTTLELIYLATNLFDMYQTSVAMKNGGIELNPFFGSHPSDSELIIKDGCWLIIKYITSRYILHGTPRKIWQYSNIIISLYYIGTSYGTKLILRIPS